MRTNFCHEKFYPVEISKYIYFNQLSTALTNISFLYFEGNKRKLNGLRVPISPCIDKYSSIITSFFSEQCFSEYSVENSGLF